MTTADDRPFDWTPHTVLPGSAPGQVAASADARPTEIRVLRYHAEALEEEAEPDGVPTTNASGFKIWIRVVGMRDVARIQKLTESVGIHPLVLEDICSLEQRPKIQADGSGLFGVLRIPVDGDMDQCSLYLGSGFLLSFEERPLTAFERVAERLRTGNPRIRRRGIDYLFYALLDACTDAYFPVIDRYSLRAQRIEDALVTSASPEILSEIHGIRRELNSLRLYLWPMRDSIQTAVRDEDLELIQDETRTFLRDVQDHAAQVLDRLAGLIDVASSLMDLYLSTSSHQMNEVMKVLTLISTIFIPLGFLAGLYGMNFEQMPELHFWWAYPLLLSLMAAIAAAMLWRFRRMGWIGRSGNGR